MKSRTRSRISNRHGYTLLELIAAMVVLGTVTATIVPVMGWAKAQRRAAESRQIAMQEASNIFERISTRKWGDVTQESAAAVMLSPAANRSLRDAALKIRVKSLAGKPEGKRISLELRWKNREGDFVAPVRLTRFVYRREQGP